jgi:universal stress protein A
MIEYRRILVAVDLTEHSRMVAQRAAQFASASSGSLHLLHVVEFIPVEPMSDTMVPTIAIDDQTIALARSRIAALAAELGLAQSDFSVAAGSAKGEILRCARERDCDLIVIGSRERHGLSILLNHTEDTVLHGAPCDVLAVRVR